MTVEQIVCMARTAGYRIRLVFATADGKVITAEAPIELMDGLTLIGMEFTVEGNE